MTTMGQRIRKARQTLGLSLTDLGKLVGVSRSAVSQWERDETEVTGRNLVKLAAALRQAESWITGGSPSVQFHTRKVNVIGYVGAGAEVFPFDDHAKGAGFDKVEAPMGLGEHDIVALAVRGSSMHPIEDGWLVFYTRDADGVPDDCLNKLCVVKVHEGPTCVKKVRRGSKKGHFTLESWNAPTQEDVRLDWAARVLDIRPK